MKTFYLCPGYGIPVVGRKGAAGSVHRQPEASLALAGQGNVQGGRPWARVESPTS